MHIVVTAPSPGWRICVLLTHLCQLKTVWQPWTIQAVALGCETTAPCDTSFKARRIEISLLTCVCNASTCIFLLQSIFCLTWINVFSITKISVRTQKWKHKNTMTCLFSSQQRVTSASAYRNQNYARTRALCYDATPYRTSAAQIGNTRWSI